MLEEFEGVGVRDGRWALGREKSGQSRACIWVGWQGRPFPRAITMIVVLRMLPPCTQEFSASRGTYCAIVYEEAMKRSAPAQN